MLFINLITIGCLILFLLVAVAYLTLFERKLLAGMQRRRGPNDVGLYGFLQAIADALKLITKENIIPYFASTFIFLFAPILIFFATFLS
jgi:NADH-quinone oxidoreductase subunit H